VPIDPEHVSSLPGLQAYRRIVRPPGDWLSETQSVNSPESASRPDSTDPGPMDAAPAGPSSETTDPESLSSCVLGQVKAKDPQAWTRMVNLYGPMIYRWARKAGLQPADSADIVQEVFRAVAMYIAELDTDRPTEGFRGWLWQIARTKLADHFRKQASAPTEGEDAFEATVAHEPELPDPDDLKTPSPDVAMVHRVLQTIRPDFEDSTWDAFWQMTVQNRSAAEAAEALQMSKSAVRQAKYRVLKRLRHELDGA